MHERVCVVTGASSGIGRAAALALSLQGTLVVLSGRNEARLEDARKACGLATALVGDVRNKKHIEELFEKAVAHQPATLSAVFCAGYAKFGPSLEAVDDTWETSIGINLTALHHCCLAAIRAMLPLGGGRIVNVLSVASKEAFPQSAAYVASKFGAYGLTKSLAAEFRRQGIAITAFMPGSTDTSMWRGQDWSPKPEEMLDPNDVGRAIGEIVLAQGDAVYDEVLFMPKKGVL